MSFWAYILRCADGSYYTGSTDNLEQLAQHQNGTFKGYTVKRRRVVLMRSQDFVSRIEAVETERRIKGWTRAKKEALINGDWVRLSALAHGGRDTDTRPSTSSGLTGV